MSKLDDLKSRAQLSMQTNPMKWAGIVAGTGFILGLAGRLLQRRSQQRSIPDLVVIETAC